MHDDVLQDVAQETLASMAFIFPAFDDQPADPSAQRLCAEVTFDGPDRKSVV